ncbi:hypothetical protein ACTXT7_002371, partial [Hymenolepis weldensis]
MVDLTKTGVTLAYISFQRGEQLRNRPNVCRFQYKTSIPVWEHFEVPYYKTNPVWKKNCGGKGIWCKVNEQRYAVRREIATSYRIVDQPVYEERIQCCDGFKRIPGFEGCVRESNCNSLLKTTQCLNGGICYENGQVTTCMCPKGFSGPRCQYGAFGVSDDRCRINNGGCEKECCNMPGGYYCRCPPGYRLAPDQRHCLDINECATNKGGCVYGCENLPGGFRCTCPEGMMLAEDKLSCRPFMDPCAPPAKGGCEHVCTTLSSYRYACSCYPGYRLAEDKKRCIDITVQCNVIKMKDLIRVNMVSEVGASRPPIYLNILMSP